MEEQLIRLRLRSLDIGKESVMLVRVDISDWANNVKQLKETLHFGSKKQNNLVWLTRQANEERVSKNKAGSKLWKIVTDCHRGGDFLNSNK